jgi:hypothetical protein
MIVFDIQFELLLFDHCLFVVFVADFKKFANVCMSLFLRRLRLFWHVGVVLCMVYLVYPEILYLVEDNTLLILVDVGHLSHAL